MSKKTKTSSNDLDSFYSAIKGVKRIISDKVPLKSSHNKPVRPPYREKEQEEVFLAEQWELDQVGNEDHISYHQAGIANKMLRKLRKGQYNVEASLDLHGMSVENAKNAVENFLKSCLDCHYRVVLIIHGKGRFHTSLPILKNKLNQWLRGLPFILAFCSAAANQGGSGALYLLLKRERGST